MVLRPSQVRRRAGFSLTELLVVIGIIVLLVGILLVALGAVQKKARKTQTVAVMNAFASACEVFQAENGRYPGVIPDDVLNANPLMSSTENALLDLVGGFRVLSPNDYGGQIETDYNNFLAAAASSGTNVELLFGSGPNPWKIAIDKKKLGDGPIVNGKQHGAYFTARKDELERLPGQLSSADNLPDLKDSWGTPIIYIRQARTRGPLTSFTGATPKPQFEIRTGSPGAVDDYLLSNALGELAKNQVYGAGNPGGSILSSGATNADRNWAQLLRHPGISPAITGTPLPPPTNVYQGTAKGAFMLISAGPDGVYFSAVDGAGSGGSPIPGGDLLSITTDAKVIEEFDDIVVFGGS